QPATYTMYTLSLHDALPIYFTIVTEGRPILDIYNVGIFKRLVLVVFDSGPSGKLFMQFVPLRMCDDKVCNTPGVYPLSKRIRYRSEEHTSELQSRENLVCRL